MKEKYIRIKKLTKDRKATLAGPQPTNNGWDDKNYEIPKTKYKEKFTITKNKKKISEENYAYYFS